jgi:hypothetical protein
VQTVSSSYENNTTTVTPGVLPFLQQPAIHMDSKFLAKVEWQVKSNFVNFVIINITSNVIATTLNIFHSRP